jgi:hypothetical protein
MSALGIWGIKKCNTWPTILCVCAITIILCPATKIMNQAIFLPASNCKNVYLFINVCTGTGVA